MSSKEEIIIARVVFYLTLSLCILEIVIVIWHLFSNNLVSWLSSELVTVRGGGTITYGLALIIVVAFEILVMVELWKET